VSNRPRNRSIQEQRRHIKQQKRPTDTGLCPCLCSAFFEGTACARVRSCMSNSKWCVCVCGCVCTGTAWQEPGGVFRTKNGVYVYGKYIYIYIYIYIYMAYIHTHMVYDIERQAAPLEIATYVCIYVCMHVNTHTQTHTIYIHIYI
jgi:hypothetical protein